MEHRTKERLMHERALAMGQAIDTSTWKSYGSALNSYLTFVRMHNFPVDPSHPTPDTLSFFTVYMSHHIKPSSVDNYFRAYVNNSNPTSHLSVKPENRWYAKKLSLAVCSSVA